MQIKDVNIKHHGRIINGTFYVPENKQKFPLVIISHGYNGFKTDFEVSAMYFASNMIGAFCYTFCGGSTRDESGFPTTDMTIFTEKEDLSAVINAALTWEHVDKDNIFLFGESQGGLVSALVTEDRFQEIKGLILLYPAFCIPDDWNNRFKSIDCIPNTKEFWGMTLGHNFFETIFDFSVFEHIGNYNGKTLIMHGKEDEIVPIVYSKRAFEKYKQSRLEIFSGEGHGFSEAGNRRMEAMTMYFIHECLDESNN